MEGREGGREGEERCGGRYLWIYGILDITYKGADDPCLVDGEMGREDRIPPHGRQDAGKRYVYTQEMVGGMYVAVGVGVGMVVAMRVLLSATTIAAPPGGANNPPFAVDFFRCRRKGFQRERESSRLEVARVLLAEANDEGWVRRRRGIVSVFEGPGSSRSGVLLLAACCNQ